MPPPPELLLTPVPTLALRQDGYLIRIVPDAGMARPPMSGELEAAADLACARGIQVLSTTAGEEQVLALPIVAIIPTIVAIGSAIGGIVGGVSGVITALEWVGLAKSKYQPIFDRIGGLHQALAVILAAQTETQQQVYAAWSAGHWRAIADLLGRSTTAVDNVRDVVLYQEDRSSPAVIEKLGRADHESRAVINTLIAGGVDGGFWFRPHFPQVLNMDGWTFRTDDRPDVTADGRIWDYRIALPTLVAAIMARVLVVRTIYPDAPERLCNETRTWTRFLGAVIQRIQTNVRRKTDFTAAEKAGHCEGTATTDFFAGAVDVTTGAHDFVNFDPWGQRALDAYYRKTGQRPDAPTPTEGRTWPGSWCPGGWINTADFSNTITWADVLAAQVPTMNHAGLIHAQGVFAENRLLWQTPIHALCDLSSALWKFCGDHPVLVGQVGEVLAKKRKLIAAVAGSGSGKKTARQAYALVEMVRDERESGDDLLRAGLALTTVMIDAQAGPAFRNALRRLVRNAAREAARIEERQTEMPPAAAGRRRPSGKRATAKRASRVRRRSPDRSPRR